MPRRLIVFLFAAVTLTGVAAGQTAAPGAPPRSPELWTEFGYQATETVTWNGPNGPVNVTAWRFADPTGAYAALQAEADRKSVLLSGNYLLSFEGTPPPVDAIGSLTAKLPNRTTSAMPPIVQYLPEKGRVAGSERYALGPAGLAQFEPRVPRELASFERGAESLTARFRHGGSELQMTVFQYPTPQIAIERFRHFEKLGGAAVKRSGTLIAVVPEARENPAAARLLAQVEYRPNLTWNEYVPKHTTQDAAKMILAISVLAAGLIVASLVLGLFFGGGKILAKKLGFKVAEEDFTSLHIGQ